MHFKRHTPKRLLIINIFGIGDVLFTTPLISNLKNRYPDIYLGYVCSPRTAGLLEKNSQVDKVITYERDEYNEACRRSKILAFKKMIHFIRCIRQERFDTCIDVSLCSFTSCVSWMAGIRHRIGFHYKNRCFFLNQKIKFSGYKNKHVVEYYLSLLQGLGMPPIATNMELTTTQEDEQFVNEFFSRRLGQRNGKPVIGVIPGGGASWGQDAKYKRWSAENYAKLADKLIEKFSANIILMGSNDELALCEEVSGAMEHRPIMACAETSISQFAALARRCSLVIVNDGGPLHIAASAGVRTASIFGPVDEQVYGPYPTGNHIVIKKGLSCQPCYRRFRRAVCDHIGCLNWLTVDEVLERITPAL